MPKAAADHALDWIDRIDLDLRARSTSLPIRDDGLLATAGRYAIKRHILIPGFAAAWGVGVLSGRQRLTRAGAVGVLGLVGAAVVSRSIKRRIRRRRPDEREGRHPGRPVSARSFPSGHAGSAFAAATAIACALGGAGEIAAVYGCAGLLASGRVIRGRHWPSDVVAGAAIGTAVSLLASRLVGAFGSRAGSRAGRRS